MENYNKTADILVERIKALIPANPQILNIKPDNATELFKIKGFKCDDLNPSYFQASWALQKAQRDSPQITPT